MAAREAGAGWRCRFGCQRAWNDGLGSLVLVQRAEARTVIPGVDGSLGTTVGCCLVLVAVVAAALPLIVVAYLFQRFLICPDEGYRCEWPDGLESEQDPVSRSFIARNSYLRYPCVDGARRTRAFVWGEVAAHMDILGARHRTKRFVREERLPGVRLDLVADHQLALDAVPIIVRDTGPYIHYPASVDDLRAVAALLPPDILLGVSAIELRLWPSWRHSGQRAADFQVQPDPYVGRRSVQLLGGAWISPSLASYRRDTARIFLHAYVYDPAWRDAAAVSVVLRFEMLCSFVHELAHHDDRRRRVARGRWTQDHDAQAEAYAQATAARWSTEHVLPYILERYSDDVRALIAWISTWDDRPDLNEEALKNDALLGAIGRIMTAWGDSRGLPGAARAQREHTTA